MFYQIHRFLFLFFYHLCDYMHNYFYCDVGNYVVYIRVIIALWWRGGAEDLRAK